MTSIQQHATTAHTARQRRSSDDQHHRQRNPGISVRNHRSRIMQHLYQHGISSRAQIAKALDLTPAAITKITAKLIEPAPSRRPAISRGARTAAPSGSLSTPQNSTSSP